MREFEDDNSIKLHIFSIRKDYPANIHFVHCKAHIHCVRATGGLRATSLFWTDTMSLRKYFREIQPDVVHAWGSENAAGLVARRLGRPYLITVQGLFGWLRERTPLNRYQRLMEFLERRELPRAPLVTVEASFAKAFLAGRYPSLRVEQIEHAPDAVFSKTQRAPEQSPRRLIFVGAMNEMKGADILLRGLAQLAAEMEFKITIVGAGDAPLVTALRNELPQGFWSRVEFKHQLTSREVAAEMARATLLLHPTRGDSSPNSVKEALVHGVPVVATTVGGIPDNVIHERNGLLVEPDNLPAFVAAVRSALAHPTFGRGEVAPGIVEESRAKLSPALMARKFKAAYESLAGWTCSTPNPRSFRLLP